MESGEIAGSRSLDSRFRFVVFQAAKHGAGMRQAAASDLSTEATREASKDANMVIMPTLAVSRVLEPATASIGQTVVPAAPLTAATAIFDSLKETITKREEVPFEAVPVAKKRKRFESTLQLPKHPSMPNTTETLAALPVHPTVTVTLPTPTSLATPATIPTETTLTELSPPARHDMSQSTTKPNRLH